LYRKVEKLIPFKHDKKLLKRTVTAVFIRKYLEKTNGEFGITVEGKKYVEYNKGEISQIESSREYLKSLQ